MRSKSSIRVANFPRSDNDTRMVGNLDSLEERQDRVSIQLADYQQKLVLRYNRNVKPKECVAGDLVLWKAVRNMKDQSAGKLAPNWEGPYRVTTIVGTGTYYLEDMKERPLPQPCNICNLKKYYS